MKSRIDFIQALIKAGNVQSYLEIGVHAGEVFNKIDVPTKVGIDTVKRATGVTVTTSDAFFATNKQKFDLIFIDGDHQMPQPLTDALTALNHLTDKGVIVMHDVYPTKKEWTKDKRLYRGTEAWCGQAWEAAYRLGVEHGHSLTIMTDDYGVGMIIPTTAAIDGGANAPITWERNFRELDAFTAPFSDIIARYERHVAMVAEPEPTPTAPKPEPQPTPTAPKPEPTPQKKRGRPRLKPTK